MKTRLILAAATIAVAVTGGASWASGAGAQTVPAPLVKATHIACDCWAVGPHGSRWAVVGF